MGWGVVEVGGTSWIITADTLASQDLTHTHTSVCIAHKDNKLTGEVGFSTKW